jgi:predicted O-methyltransferase YrrM
MYAGGDAALYSALLRHLRPPRVLEIGSGYSTAVALDTADQHLEGLDLACVDPNPERLLGALLPGDADRIGLERCLVQDLPLERYDELRAGDFLFIDSSHVVKPGSDVVWLVLQVLPRLAPGVLVHVHDIFWPFEYPDRWLQEGRDWTEGYLLNAFLSGNRDWEVVLFSSWLWAQHPEVLPQALRGLAPSSIWLRRRSA